MNESFKYIRPDEVAECWDGVPDDLYTALWASMDGMPSLKEQIHMEESAPGDAVGLNTVESVWHLFTPAQQETLNALAEVQDGE